MATEVFEFVLKLRDEASGPLDSARSKAQSLGGASERVGKQVEALRKAQLDLASAINVAAQATERDEGRLHALKLELEATTRELNRLTGAKQQAVSASGDLAAGVGRAAGPTRNLGQSALEASRAIEDLQYGIGGVLNNIPSLVMSLGGSAGVAGALSVAAVGAAFVAKKVIEFKKEIDDADRASNAWKETLASLATQLDNRLAKSLEESKRRIEEARTELRNFGLDAQGIRENDQRLSVAGLEGNIASIDRDIAKRTQAIEDLKRQQKALFQFSTPSFSQLEASRESIAQQVEILDKVKAKREAITEALKDQKAALETLSAVGDALAKKELARDAPKEQRRAEREEDAEQRRFLRQQQAQIDMENATLAEQERADERRLALQQQRDAKAEAQERAHQRELERLRKEEEREHKRIEKEKTRVAEEAARERARVAKHEAGQIVGLYADVSGALVQAGVAIAQGQDDAVANLVAALSREAGGFVTLKGAELAAQGIAAAAGGNPAGVGQAAIGLGLVTAGQAITYGGPAVAASIFGGGGGSGGASSGARTTSGASTPRSSSSSSSSSSSEPGVTEINVYFGGPPVGRARENVAIDLNDAERRNNRRGRRR
jgi:hypothetical protein